MYFNYFQGIICEILAWGRKFCLSLVLYLFKVFGSDYASISIFSLWVKSVLIEFFLVCTSLYSNWILTFTRTKYGYLLRKYPYLFRIQENTDQKKLRIWALFMQYQNGTTIFCSFHISFFKVKRWSFIAQKVKLSIKDFFSKCDQMSHLLKKSLTENFIFVQFFSVDWRRFKKMCRSKGLLDFGN